MSDPECTCKHCIAMCERPCWPTPTEALTLMEKGFGARLMKDWWVRDTSDLYVICPAVPGYEGKLAPDSRWNFTKPCVFLKEERCEIHTLKPYEGRVADCSKRQPSLHMDTAMLWDNPEGMAVVKEWTERFLIKEG